MLCQDCHKNAASIRYAEVVDGTVSDLNLCQSCLSKRQESVGQGFELNAPSPFLRKEPTGGPDELIATTGPEACRACSTDLLSIMETGKVGCSACYETFPAQLESLMEGIHLSLSHRGKVPRLDDARARVRSELQGKRALLKTSLRMENYEEAASLRDEIRALEHGLVASEAGAD